jgi:type IV secretory pathway TrbD component
MPAWNGRSEGEVMDPRANGQPPPGYEAPIFNAMNNDQLVAFVPRPILCVMVLLCAGLWLLSRSWGAGLFYLVLHAIAAYFTYRDPQWLPILKEALQYRYRLWRLSFTPDGWRAMCWRMGVITVVLVVTLYIVSLWLR